MIDAVRILIHSTIALVIASTTYSASVGQVLSHEMAEPLDALAVEQVEISTADLGGTSRVRFLLDNFSGATVTSNDSPTIRR